MSESFKRWYEKNKEILSDKRKRRYKEDRFYREAARKRSLEYYKEKTKHREKKDRRIVFTKEGTCYYSISVVAKAIKRNDHTVRAYHKKGIIPEENLVYDKRGWRLYSKYQLELLERTFSRETSLQNIKKILCKYWR